MGIFLVILTVIILGGLVLAAAMQPVRSSYSLAELKRRSKYSEAFLLELDRHELYVALTTFLRVVRAILLVVLVCLLIGLLGWWLGVVVALIVAIVYPVLARMHGVQKAGKGLYKKIEPGLLDAIARFERILHAFREPAVTLHQLPKEVYSREELIEVIEQSKEALGERERQLVAAALAFPDKAVASIMTPRDRIDFIKSSEFLGPLVLDELHGLGHSQLLVIKKDLDEIIGVLHLTDMLSLDIKNSTTAEKAMEKKVFYVHQSETLEAVLGEFLKHHCDLLIVVDDDKKTLGLITLQDVVAVLLSHPITHP